MVEKSFYFCSLFYSRQLQYLKHSSGKEAHLISLQKNSSKRSPRKGTKNRPIAKIFLEGGRGANVNNRGEIINV